MDGASSNRRLIKLHQQRSDIVYKVTNPYSEDRRSLYFVSDPPHLLKTIRNYWSNRLLWVRTYRSLLSAYVHVFCLVEKWEIHSLGTSEKVI